MSTTTFFYLSFIISVLLLYKFSIPLSIFLLFVAFCFFVVKKKLPLASLILVSYLIVFFFHYKKLNSIPSNPEEAGQKFISTGLYVTGFVEKSADNKYYIDAYPCRVYLEEYKLLYKTQKVKVSGFIRNKAIFAKEIEIEKEGFFLHRFTGILRETVFRYIEKIKLSDFKNLIFSFLLGNKSYLDYETKENFRITGLAHLLALSGLHTGIIAFFVSTIFGLVFRKKLWFILTTLFLICYILLTGLSPPIMRASLMFIIYFYFVKLKGLINIEHSDIVLFTAFVSILISPESLFSLSFILSYLSILGISFLKLPFENLLSFLPEKIKTSFSITLSANIFTLPVLLYYFKSVNLISLISNLIVIPVFSVFLILLFLNFIIFFVNEGFSYIIFEKITSLPWKYCKYTASYLSFLPFNMNVKNFGGFHLVFSYLLLGLVIFVLPQILFFINLKKIEEKYN